MKTFGVDYLDSTDNIVKYLVVDSDNLENAKKKAIELLKEYNIPKRNIVQIEELKFLER